MTTKLCEQSILHLMEHRFCTRFIFFVNPSRPAPEAFSCTIRQASDFC